VPSASVYQAHLLHTVKHIIYITSLYVTFTAAVKFCLRLVSPWNSWMLMMMMMMMMVMI